jgi:hypothetical protein
MTRLSPVLSTDDLPLAELCAARLDGEVVAVDDCFAPIDGAVDPIARATAAARVSSARLIAEQRTAAWIWGATTDPPARHQWCTSTIARARPRSPGRGVVREVVIADDEVATVGVLRVTTPLRTVVDLARFSPLWDEPEHTAARRLVAIGALDLDGCTAALERRRNLPNKRLAYERLAAACAAAGPVLPGQPELTR